VGLLGRSRSSRPAREHRRSGRVASTGRGPQPITRPCRRISGQQGRLDHGSRLLQLVLREREHVTFSAADIAAVKGYLAQCTAPRFTTGADAPSRHLAAAAVAQTYLPELRNDREINEFDRDVEGRLDCVDSASNTTTYLRISRISASCPAGP